MEKKEALQVLMDRYDISQQEASILLPPEGDGNDPLGDWWRWSPERMHQMLTDLEEWADNLHDEQFPDPLEGARLGE